MTKEVNETHLHGSWSESVSTGALKATDEVTTRAVATHPDTALALVIIYKAHLSLKSRYKPTN